MNRTLLRAAVLAALAALVPHGTPANDETPSKDAPSLEAELNAILGEILESENGGDPFEAGAVPDLVILGSTNVFGEVAPCG